MTEGIWRRAAAVCAGALVLSAAGLAHAELPEPSIGLPYDASVEGHRIDWLLEVTVLFTGVLFAIMCIWMFAAAIFHNERHVARHDHGNSKKQIGVTLLIAAAIFFVVDGNLFLNSTIDVESVFWNFEGADAKPDVVRVQVNAHQWAWDFRYAGNDGEFGTADDVVSLNDMRVPVGRTVLMQLASVDVIHSFSLPNMRVKQDVVPGMVNKMRFTSRETGRFEIACTQHCGVNHYLMRGELTVLDDEQYERWLSEQSEQAERKFEQGLENGPTERFLQSQWAWNWEENI